MTKEQTKEDFEKWLTSLSHDKLVYLDEESAWCGWMAAHEKYIEGLVVTLPAWDEYDCTRQTIDAVKEALDDVGVKYE
jgi:hypothetical protein